MGTKVRDVMTDRPRCVTLETPISEVAQLMESEDIGSLPVLEGDQLAGMVTDRDIVLRAVAKGKDPRGMPVREVASRELVTVYAEDDLSNALKKMASQQVRRLPVVDEENRLVGVLAQADVALEVKEKAAARWSRRSPSPRRARVCRSSSAHRKLVASDRQGRGRKSLSLAGPSGCTLAPATPGSLGMTQVE